MPAQYFGILPAPSNPLAEALEGATPLFEYIGQRPAREKEMVQTFLEFYSQADPSTRAALEASPNYQRMLELANKHFPGTVAQGRPVLTRETRAADTVESEQRLARWVEPYFAETDPSRREAVKRQRQEQWLELSQEFPHAFITDESGMLEPVQTIATRQATAEVEETVSKIQLNEASIRQVDAVIDKMAKEMQWGDEDRALAREQLDRHFEFEYARLEREMGFAYDQLGFTREQWQDELQQRALDRSLTRYQIDQQVTLELRGLGLREEEIALQREEIMRRYEALDADRMQRDRQFAAQLGLSYAELQERRRATDAEIAARLKISEDELAEARRQADLDYSVVQAQLAQQWDIALMQDATARFEIETYAAIERAKVRIQEQAAGLTPEEVTRQAALAAATIVDTIIPVDAMGRRSVVGPDGETIYLSPDDLSSMIQYFTKQLAGPYYIDPPEIPVEEPQLSGPAEGMPVADTGPQYVESIFTILARAVVESYEMLRDSPVEYYPIIEGGPVWRGTLGELLSGWAEEAKGYFQGLWPLIEGATGRSEWPWRR